jgi:hypothetical protein
MHCFSLITSFLCKINQKNKKVKRKKNIRFWPTNFARKRFSQCLFLEET